MQGAWKILLDYGADLARRVLDGPHAGGTALDIALYEAQRNRQSDFYHAAIALLRPISPAAASERAIGGSISVAAHTWTGRPPRMPTWPAKILTFRNRFGSAPALSAVRIYLPRRELLFTDFYSPQPMMWKGPPVAEEGCLVCHGHNLAIMYDHRGISYSDALRFLLGSGECSL
ncbi:MAG: hypothetical protein MZV70_17350 [Desulfobacterales bacterium]|nr:hypothetical protein [Desulfobacterales bacterium]